MSTTRLGHVTLLVALDAILLLAVGAAMWHDAPFGAEEAVGKGLFVMGVALAVPGVYLAVAYLDSRPPREPDRPGATRSDWDSV